jgi:hypothetical protein
MPIPSRTENRASTVTKPIAKHGQHEDPQHRQSLQPPGAVIGQLGDLLALR